MKKRMHSLGLLVLSTLSSPLFAQTTMSEFSVEFLSTIVYSALGIVMAVVGFKVVDWLTPGDLAEDVAHKENRALAVLAGAMMLGVCIIIASAVVG